MPSLTVIPAEAGIQILVLDPGLRRGDGVRAFTGFNDLKADPLPIESEPLTGSIVSCIKVPWRNTK